MTTHFTRDQFVDALDRSLTSEREAHVAVCADCANQLAEMRLLMDDVTRAGVVPEPSPLFWDHLSARVRDAVNAEPLPAAPWWGGWRTFATVVGVVGVIVLAGVLRPSRRGAIVPTDAPGATIESVAAGEGTSGVWDMMAAVAPSMAADDIFEAGLQPGRGVTSAAIASLTNAQRQELMKLLRAEMRGSREGE